MALSVLFTRISVFHLFWFCETLWHYFSDLRLSLFMVYCGLPWRLSGKNLPANVGDAGSIPGSGRSPGERNDNPLQYFAWEIPWTEEPDGLQSMGS